MAGECRRSGRRNRLLLVSSLVLAAAVTIWAAKFRFDQQPFVYAGMAALAGAAVWASWPRRSPDACHGRLS